MLFTSFPFLLLASVTFFLYYLKPLSRLQVLILVIASLVFYSYTTPKYLLLLLFSATINITASYLIAIKRSKWKKAIAVGGVAMNLGILAFFKYSPLMVEMLGTEHTSLGQYLLYMPLPIGISFFTFEGISLVVDVFSEKYTANKNLTDHSFWKHAQRTLFFISFFPHLVAGPILKAHDFYPQISHKKYSDINWEKCFKNLIMGYFLKMVVADNLNDFTFRIGYPYFEGDSSITLVVMLFGYSCQIFADFAGYSLIAIGLAGLFGYKFMDNFNFPYISTSFKEFWKRWHISLSTFLMEYLYFPLGGNRNGKARTYMNLMITMILGGLWHGAAWSYAVWGGFHGAALASERFLSEKIKMKPSRVLNFFKGLVVFFFVTWAWLLFKLPNFNHVIGFMKAIRTNFSLADNSASINYILLYSIPVLVYHAAYTIKDKKIFDPVRRSQYWVYGIMFFLIITNSGRPGSFIYFQF